MRILFVLHEKKLGGASKSVVALIKELKELGHDICVVTPFGHGPVFEALRELNIPIKTIFYGWWMMPSYWPLPFKLGFRCLYALEGIAVRRICTFAKKRNIRIIHSNSSVIDVGARSAMRLKIPHVWHFREYGDKDFSLEYLRGRSESCRYINTVNGKCIFISRDLLGYYSNDISREKSTIIYNGVSGSYIQDKNYSNIGNKEIVFMITGTLHKTKRQDLALKACRILSERNYEFKILLAGTSSVLKESKEYEKDLKRYAERYLPGYVEFSGYTKEMNELRMRSDVELVCSSREAFGRVTVEAMLSGNPVIGADSGANPELIEDGVTGMLFEAGNASALADKMEKFIVEPENIRIYGLNAKRFAKNFLADRNAKEIEELYKKWI